MKKCWGLTIAIDHGPDKDGEKLYALYDADEKVEGKHFDFEHNYNALSRAMMYAFFDKHFDLGHQEIVEQEYQPLTRSEMTVWGPDHPKPPCGEAAEVEAIIAFNQALICMISG